jgi:hypothetical protein
MHPDIRAKNTRNTNWQRVLRFLPSVARVQLINQIDLRPSTNTTPTKCSASSTGCGSRHSRLSKTEASHFRTTHTGSRKQSGIVELPFVVWIFLFVLTFPLINLATIGLRLTFLYSAAHTACLRACRGQTFQTAVENSPSCIMLANQAVQDVTQKFTGIHVSKITTQILTTSIDTGIQSRTVSPLTKPADVSKNTYQIEVVLDCSADPFLPMPSPVQIAGLSAPLQLTLSDRQYCESPDGLNL